MDLAEIDENGKGLLFFGETKVEKLEQIEGQPNVFLLETTATLDRKTQLSPKAGQFYLIRSKKTTTNYNRPISVYHSEEKITQNGKKEVKIQFMILEKGRGTQELCHMYIGEPLSLIGPLGTEWPLEDAQKIIADNKEKTQNYFLTINN